MINCAIYFRYSSSTERQKQNSEKRQRVELIEKALSNNWNIVWNNGDKETSGDKTKPKLEELKSLVSKKEVKVDVVLVSSLDRLTRKDSLEYADDVAWIRSANAKLCCLDSGDELIDLNDNQKLLLLQMKIFAGNQYLKDLANKTASGQVARFKRGELGWSNIPFGFKRVEGGIQPDEDIEVVKEIFKVFCQTETIGDCLSLIARSKKYKEKEVGVNRSLVKRILRHPIYMGKRVWGVEGVGDHFQVKGSKTGCGLNVNRIVEATDTLDITDQIGKAVDDSIWYRANAILDHNQDLYSKRTRGKDPRATYKYSSFITCSCGKKFVGVRSPKGFRSYVCPDSKLSRTKCGSSGRKTISQEDLDLVIKSVKNTLQQDEDFHRQNFDKYISWLEKKKIGSIDEGLRDIEELAVKKKKLASILESALNTDGGDVPQHLLDIIQKKQQEIANEESRLKELAEDGSSIDELFSGERQFGDPNIQKRLDHIRRYAEKVIDSPEDREFIFNEYFGLLKMMIKDGVLAPVYINGVEIFFKNGKDKNNRKRNIPSKFRFDIGQMTNKIECRGTTNQAGICLTVSTTRRIPLLFLSNK